MKNMFRKILTLTLAFIMLLSVMPAVISAAYRTPFEDVKTTDYFYEPVIWAYGEGITTGTTATKFAPDDTCTRGQVVTFLWRAMGEPEPVTKENRFNDVKDTDYYYKPVLWAVENGITNGTSEKMFSPAVTCTNAHILTFIWRALGEEGRTGEGEWYDDAVNWAAESGMLKGTFTGTFVPSGKCPRANVVTYLYRYLESGRLTVYVSSDADASLADGSLEKPFATIEAARDYVRTVDRSEFTGIDIRIGAGEYSLTSSLLFTKDDSGTVSCPVRYIGETGTELSGGVAFTSDDFSTASGDTVKYFPESLRDKIVMIDLKQFGFKPENVIEMTELAYGNKNAFLFADGNKMTVARYPNDEFATVCAGSRINSDGGYATAIDFVDTTTICFGAEHMEHVKTWHDLEHTFTLARYNNLWCPDNTNILSVDEAGNSMDVIFAGGYDPKEGMPFFWYNIPEELDVPGEYYIDENCVLYLYPTDKHAQTVYSMPVLIDNLVTLDGVEYITFKGIRFTSTRGDGISGKGNHITVDGCDISYIGVTGVYIDGMNNTIENSTAKAIGQTAFRLAGGDQEKLIRSGNLIYNNYVTNWSIGMGLMAFAYSVHGCGATIAHNECENSVDMGIEYNGPYHTVEYNYCGDTCQFFGDGGVIGSGDIFAYGTVVRYNYVKNAGFTRDLAIDIVGVQGITVDCGQSGLTAYGNVIENVTGSGFGLSGGRDLDIYGNLMISCRYGMFYDGRFLLNGLDAWENRGENSTIDNGANRVRQGQWQVENENWLKAFPVLGTYTYYEEGMDYSKDCLGRKTFVSAPVSKIYSNVYYLDKATHDKYAMNKPYLLDWAVEEYSGDSVKVPSAEDGTLYTFSSKRNSYDIEECVMNNQSVLAITPEQFRSIGKVR